MRVKFSLSVMLFLLISGFSAAAKIHSVVSPDGKVSITSQIDANGALCYNVKRGSSEIITNSDMGIVIDSENLGTNVSLIGKATKFQEDESYPWAGNKSTLRNHYNGLSFVVQDKTTKGKMQVELRAYNDGVAFRYILADKQNVQVKKELTSFNIAKDSDVWYRLNRPQYEKLSQKGKVPAIEKDFNLQLPLTIALPNDEGFAAITEAGSFLYSGMSLVANGTDKLTSYFASDKKGFKVQGRVVTPWRVIMTGPTLNDLANCDIVYNVCPHPDKELFPDGKMSDWIKPGRSLWNWWAYGKKGIAWDMQKKMVDQAAEMKCEYYLVDDGWEMYQYGWFEKGHNEDRWEKLK